MVCSLTLSVNTEGYCSEPISSLSLSLYLHPLLSHSPPLSVHNPLLRQWGSLCSAYHPSSSHPLSSSISTSSVQLDWASPARWVHSGLHHDRSASRQTRNRTGGEGVGGLLAFVLVFMVTQWELKSISWREQHVDWPPGWMAQHLHYCIKKQNNTRITPAKSFFSSIFQFIINPIG